MNDKELDLIQQVLRAAGKAGEQGFAHLVRYTMIDGITTMLFCAAAFAGCAWLLRRAFSWKGTDDWLDETSMFRGAAICILCITLLALLAGFFSGLTTALAPEGAAIHAVLK